MSSGNGQSYSLPCMIYKMNRSSNQATMTVVYLVAHPSPSSYRPPPPTCTYTHLYLHLTARTWLRPQTSYLTTFQTLTCIIYAYTSSQEYYGQMDQVHVSYESLQLTLLLSPELTAWSPTTLVRRLLRLRARLHRTTTDGFHTAPS